MPVERSHQPVTGIESRTGRSSWPALSQGLLSRLAISVAHMRRSYSVRPSCAVVLGAGQQAEQIRQNIGAKRSPGELQIRGFVALQNEETCVPPELVFHSDDITTLLRESGSNVLIIAPDGQLRYPEIQQILDCKLRGVKMMCASGTLGG